jgi:hypothetical protein
MPATAQVATDQRNNMKRRVVASVTALLWALWAALGYHLTDGVVQQHAPGYPSPGQWHYYVYFPLAMVFMNLGLLVVGRRLPVALFVTVLVAEVIVFIPFFLGYTGGV